MGDQEYLIANDPQILVFPDMLDLMEWPVNCFLKELKGIPYSKQLECAKLYRNDVQVIIRHVTIS